MAQKRKLSLSKTTNIMAPTHLECYKWNFDFFFLCVWTCFVSFYLQVIDLKTQLNEVKILLRNKFGFSKSDKILSSTRCLLDKVLGPMTT